MERNDEEVQKILKEATYIMKELKDTEYRYYQLLLLSETYYFTPLMENKFIEKGDTMYRLFYGLIGIRKISKRMYGLLDENLDFPNPDDPFNGFDPYHHISMFKKNCHGLWDIFNECFNHLRLYASYLTQHNKEKDKVVKDFDVGTKMGRFCYDQQMKFVQNSSHLQPLAVDILSVFISPIQRLPRYQLMLKSIFDVYVKKIQVLEDYAPDFGKVNGAYHLMCFVCEYVNNKPQQIKSDEVLKKLLRIEQWAMEARRNLSVNKVQTSQKSNLVELRKTIKARQKELKTLYNNKIKKDEYLIEKLDKVYHKVTEKTTLLDNIVKSLLKNFF